MKITIVGCGNMGMIYARAFLKYNIVSKENLLLAEKSEKRKEELLKLNIGQVCVVNDKRISESDIVILAVKPQDFEMLSLELRQVLTSDNIIISIMAGMKLGRISSALVKHNIIRAMPNSPAELGMGMTAFTASKVLSIEQIRKAENLLATTGRTVFFENEDLLDAVTALSGSGPAYFFYIVKQMIEAGKSMGFDEATSAMLVKQTMLGSFHLINTANKSLDELIQAVASRGGTTEAALTVFEDQNVGKGLQQGIIKARDRASQLSQ
ncbi:MAG: pyrroline-5-carboxylate reductase [Bacteroidetes bacterium]|jgi:pyrroline-5-carboxylate reductase|nr:pyrroline-5-carboxylate reductase [Bacteroidota bacterium]